MPGGWHIGGAPERMPPRRATHSRRLPRCCPISSTSTSCCAVCHCCRLRPSGRRRRSSRMTTSSTRFSPGRAPRRPDLLIHAGAGGRSLVTEVTTVIDRRDPVTRRFALVDALWRTRQPSRWPVARERPCSSARPRGRSSDQRPDSRRHPTQDNAGQTFAHVRRLLAGLSERDLHPRARRLRHGHRSGRLRVAESPALGAARSVSRARRRRDRPLRTCARRSASPVRHRRSPWPRRACGREPPCRLRRLR